MSLDSRIFNTEKTDYEKPALFLGQSNGLIDTVNKCYPKIWDLYKFLKSIDWSETEFDFSPCNTEFKTCPRPVYEMMIKTLAWQWEADSVAGRNIVPIVAPFVSSSELWTAWSAVGANECLTGDHEVLTPAGWKRIDEVTMEDRVAQWNYETRAISFIHPEEVITRHYEGPLYHFKGVNNNLSQQTTANHRMPIVYPHGVNEARREFRLAQDVKYHGGNAIPVSGYVGHGQAMTPQEQLYAAVHFDGTVSVDKENRAYYRFCFSSPEKIGRLFDLCKRAGWEIKEIDSPFGNSSVSIFYVYPPEAEYNLKADTFNWIELDRIGYKWIMDLLEELVFWSAEATSQNKTLRYMSNDSSSAGKLAAMIHMVGFQASTIQQGNTYHISIVDKPYVIGSTIVQSVTEYSGSTFCLSVPTGYFMVRHQNAVSVTGNCLHSLTYSEIVRNSFDHPDDILKEILAVKESFSRLEAVSAVMADTYETSHRLALGFAERNQATYNKIFMFVVAMYALERIQFMASFAVTFAIADTGMFQPIGSAVQKICQDEYEVHVQLNRAVLDYELQTDFGLKAFTHCRPLIETLINEVVQSELNWVDYLFSEGRELAGMNSELLKAWVLYSAKEVYEYFAIKAPYEIPKKNPIPFIEDWIRIDAIQASPQENRANSYMVGMVVMDHSEAEIEIEL